MKIDWVALILSVILLWFPIMVLVPKAVREKLKNPARNRMVKYSRVAMTWQNWVDFVRAIAGCYLLLNMAMYVPPDFGDMATAKLGIQVAIVAIGVWLQVIWHQDQLIVIAPAFFLVAITIMFAPPMVAFFGIFLGLTIAFMTNQFHWQLWTIPVAIVIFAYFFKALDLKVMVVSACYFIPIVLEMSSGYPAAFLCTRVSAPVNTKVPRTKL